MATLPLHHVLLGEPLDQVVSSRAPTCRSEITLSPSESTTPRIGVADRVAVRGQVRRGTVLELLQPGRALSGSRRGRTATWRWARCPGSCRTGSTQHARAPFQRLGGGTHRRRSYPSRRRRGRPSQHDVSRAAATLNWDRPGSPPAGCWYAGRTAWRSGPAGRRPRSGMVRNLWSSLYVVTFVRAGSSRPVGHRQRKADASNKVNKR